MSQRDVFLGEKTIVHDAVRRAVDSGAENGIHVGVYHRGEAIINIWDGYFGPDRSKSVSHDTLYNIYSVTKAVVATALHMQVERGALAYDDKITDHWPDYGKNGKESTTVRHALTHRAGVPLMPENVTPELMCDWGWMCDEIANMTPLETPGEKTLYQSMTFGWLIGELVCRTDPKSRDFNTFVQEEICQPLGIKDLWIGIPDSAADRVAVMSDRNENDPPPPLATLFSKSMPPAVSLIPSVFSRPDVQRACIPGVGGIANAFDLARFWAMLAEGGALDGVRLLEEGRVKSFTNIRDNGDEPDPVMFGAPIPISIGGYWLGGHRVTSDKAIWHPGAGGSIGWADLENRLAVSICHNQMFNAFNPEDDPILPITQAIKSHIGLE